VTKIYHDCKVKNNVQYIKLWKQNEIEFYFVKTKYSIVFNHKKKQNDDIHTVCQFVNNKLNNPEIIFSRLFWHACKVRCKMAKVEF
jgi:hypothetical protein